MNKKVLVVAVAGALCAPVLASAAGDSSVTLFGRIQAEYSSTKVDTTGANDYRQEVISDNAAQSRWGMQIHEDLGNGLSANGRIEFGFRTGAGVAENAREQWVGLSSKSWGEVQFGRIQSPLKDYVGGYTIDPFGDTNLQGAGAGGAMYAPNNGLGVNGSVDHAIRYKSPDFGGFTFHLVYVPSDATQAEPSAAGAGGTGGKGGANDFQIAGKYKFGSTGEVFAAYSRDNASDAQSAATNNGRRGDDETVWRIGGKVTFADFTLVGQYDRINDALVNGGSTCGGGGSGNGGGDAGISTAQCNTSLNANGDGNIWFLGAHYKLGKTLLVVQGGRTKADSVSNTAGVLQANERKAKNFTIGAIYNFSKRTRVFGGYQKVNVEGARDVTNTTSTGTAVLARQPDRSTWEIGLRHDF